MNPLGFNVDLAFLVVWCGAFLHGPEDGIAHKVHLLTRIGQHGNEDNGQGGDKEREKGNGVLLT
jgi:hypothetical protein